MARLSRRSLIGSAGFTALAGIAAVSIAKPDAQAVEVLPVTHDPDGPFLALCARFLELQAAIDVTYNREEEEYRLMKRQGVSNKKLCALEKQGDAERDPWQSEQHDLLEQISEITAVTLAGQRARARVLMGWYSLRDGGEHSCSIDWSDLAPLFRDLIGEAV